MKWYYLTVALIGIAFALYWAVRTPTPWWVTVPVGFALGTPIGRLVKERKRI